jgi:tRNA pseudouridine55 synthase
VSARGEAIDGVMLLDKPLGLSSNAALQRVRRLVNAKKAGHTGTLDPLATGLLPLCFGNATKYSADLLNADKGYAARVRLGETTPSGDAESEVTERRDVNVTLPALMDAALRFTGEIEQVPPMYSAIKVNGRALYRLARAGESVERKPRRVTVKRLEVSDFDGRDFTMTCLVSKGTYIRVLAEDIGRSLGCGAHLLSLRRTSVGDLTVGDAVTMEQIESAGSPEAARKLLKGADALLKSLPEVRLGETDASRLMSGQRLALRLTIRGLVRVYGPENKLLGTAKVNDRGVLEPERLIAH